MKAIISLLRPKQWIKNLFVVLPPFFNGTLTQPDIVFATCVAFISFCLSASAIYCLNDIIDREADRLHKIKRQRPVASGRISVGTAFAVMAVCIIVALSTCFLLDMPNSINLLGVIAAYIVINIAYCLWLKRVAIVDVLCISTGFVLRLFAGGTACDIELSQWIVLLAFLIALFLAFAKRRDDLVIYLETGVLPRKNVTSYNKPFIDMSLAIISASAVICYIMYTLDPNVLDSHGSRLLYLSSVFVLAGLLRYLQLAIVENRSGSPTELVFTDHFLQICIALWATFFAFILYV